MLDSELLCEDCILAVASGIAAVESPYCRGSGVVLGLCSMPPVAPAAPAAPAAPGHADTDADPEPDELILTPLLSVLGVHATPSFSLRRAFSTSLSTSDACAFFNVFFTNPAISILHRRSTSSLSHSPSFGTPRPSSATSRGSPGRFPPSVHLFLISTLIGAKTCVCSPTARSWKQAV